MDNGSHSKISNVKLDINIHGYALTTEVISEFSGIIMQLLILIPM